MFRAQHSERAELSLTIGLFVFIGTLVSGALLFILLEQAHAPIMQTANTTSYANNSSRLTTGMNRAQILWDNWAFFVLALSSILGIVSAAFSSRRP